MLLAASMPGLSARAETPVGQPLYAGAAKVDLTSRQSAKATGKFVRDPLEARVVFLRSGSTCAVIAGVDKALIPTAVVEGVRDQLKECPRDSIVVSATHTHSGDDLPTAWMEPANVSMLQEAIVRAARQAASKVRKARVGFNTTDLHLNVNRDHFDGTRWYQETSKEGVSDKTMTVLSFVDDADMPIAMVMNYGMHPINFFLSGVVSADFPGEAARYVERRYPDAVAVFTQAASGDQNPLLSRPLGKLLGPRLNARTDDKARSPSFWERAADDARDRPGSKSTPAPPQDRWTAEYRREVADVGEIVTAMGAVMGETAIEVMRDRRAPLRSDVRLWSGSRDVTCPGRDRIETKHREGIDPGYSDGEPVRIKVGLLRIGDVSLIGIDSEVYTEIVQHLKQRSPLADTMVVGLANGLANSGYIYSDNAAYHLTFEVIGSRLKPGCAEHGIIDGAMDLIASSGR